MSLHDLWHQQRQQRQRSVFQLLSAAQQQRQAKGAQMRDDLSLFRSTLNRSDAVRRQQFLQFQAELRQLGDQRQIAVKQFLTAVGESRQVQAQQTTEELSAYMEALRQQTATFLAATSADRSAMAQALSNDLQAFHQALNAQVEGLRQNLRNEVSTLRAETQELLSNSRRDRSLIYLQTVETLAAFVETLRSDVQNQLATAAVERQQRATQLQQDLAESRSTRQAEVSALFDQLAGFRAELHQFRTNLHQQVWGTSDRLPAPPPVASAPAPKPAPKASQKPALQKPKPPIPPVGAFQRGSSLAVIPAPAKPSQPESMAHEKEVYNHIFKMQGARLTEIEAALNINRFQTVDALRSLIKKGLVTQRDRVYLAQENLVPIKH